MAAMTNWVAAAAVLLIGGAAAAGEMVVIATTAPGIEEGRVVQTGERLALPPGATVTLLAADGETVTLQGEDAVVPASGGARPGSSLLDALRRLIGGDDGLIIGGTRSGSAACAVDDKLSAAERIGALVQQGCLDEARAALDALRRREVTPALWLSTDAGPQPTYRVGDMMTLLIQANFDASLYCYYGQSDGTLVPIFPAAASDGRINGGEALELPGTALPGDLELAQPGGSETVHCFATERDVTGELPPALSDRNFTPIRDHTAADLADAFAALPDTRRAQARLTVTVQP